MLNRSVKNMNDQKANRGRTLLTGSKLLVAAVVPMMLMTGCANVSKRHFTVGSVQDSYKTRHPIVIEQNEQTLDIPVAANSRSLPRAQMGSVEGFANRFRKTTTGPITILIPDGSPNERAARSVSNSLIESIAKSGVSYDRIRTARYDASRHGASAPIRLSYIAVAANAGECGKWTEDLAGANIQNKNYHNFGCASQNNLASMIANPTDLVAPRGMSDIDAERRNQSITDYRNGDIKLGNDLKTSLAN